MEKNRIACESGDLALYPHMPYDRQTGRIVSDRLRWLLEDHDRQTLRRMINTMVNGIKPNSRAAHNIDEWLDPQSPMYDAELKRSTLFYRPRTQGNERLELIISTPPMQEAAWQLGHENQVLLDATFGVSVHKMIVFIVMAVDKNWRGVPIAMMMFSAPEGNRATSAGYNGEIVALMLSRLREGLKRDGRDWSPSVWITDSDVKERNAILRVWPTAVLLLCRFHLRQAWRNNANKKIAAR